MSQMWSVFSAKKPLASWPVRSIRLICEEACDGISYKDNSYKDKYDYNCEIFSIIARYSLVTTQIPYFKDVLEIFNGTLV